jgi:pimeloyl-ACP methyl ester carboxylesterase
MCLHLHEAGRPGGRTLMYLHLLTGAAGRCWPDTRIQLSPPHPVLTAGTAGRQDAPVLTSVPALPSVAHVLVGQVITVLEKRRVPGQALLMGDGIAAAMAAVVSAVRPDLVCAAVLEDPPWFSPAPLTTATADLDRMRLPTSWVDVAAAITRPTLVVTGDREDDVLIGARTRRQLAALDNPALEVVVVAGAGHDVRRGAPEAYFAAVEPWVSRHLGADAWAHTSARDGAGVA